MATGIKTRLIFQIAAAGAAALALLGCKQSEGDASSTTRTSDAVVADAVYTNGRIYTVNEQQPWAEALAVKDGKLLAVGSNAEIDALAGPQTQARDLEGRMVMPGIHDTHIHPSDAGIQKRLQCSFLTTKLSNALKAISACIADTPKGEWVRGGQWNDGLFDGTRTPREILDDISPDHPVFLMDWSVHNAWVNTLALEYFGIDGETPDPNGGVIVRDVSGTATGILLDNAAYDYRRTLPKYKREQIAEELAWSINEIAQHGVTTIKAALVATPTLEAYTLLNEQQRLPLRVKTNLTWKSSWADSHEEEIALLADRENRASERVDTSFAKIMLDGIPPTYTAALLEPYAPNDMHPPDYRGKLMLTPEELKEDVIKLDAQGLTVKMHATGDRSARVALDAVEAARAANGDSGLIHEVSHAETIHPDDIPRFKELNVAAEMCPILWYPIAGLSWETWLGPDRSKVWPVKKMLDSGALVIYGSDWPVVPTPNPWPGIESMVTRADPYAGGAQDWPEQAVTLEQTIRIFTHNGAIANKVGDQSGSLEPGKDADFIVLDRNIFEVPIDEVGQTQVVLSIVGGARVAGTL